MKIAVLFMRRIYEINKKQLKIIKRQRLYTKNKGQKMISKKCWTGSRGFSRKSPAFPIKYILTSTKPLSNGIMRRNKNHLRLVTREVRRSPFTNFSIKLMRCGRCAIIISQHFLLHQWQPPMRSLHESNEFLLGNKPHRVHALAHLLIIPRYSLQ